MIKLRVMGRGISILLLSATFLMVSLPSVTWGVVPVSREWTPNQIRVVEAKAKEGDSVAEELLGYFYMYGMTGGHKVPFKGNFPAQHFSKPMTLPTLDDVLPTWGDQVIITRRYPPAVDKRYELEPDYATAAYWLRKAANQGNDFAQCYLAVLYAEGKGVKQNYAEAAKWLKNSAAAPNARAEYYLAHFYLEGKGVPESGPEAAKWLLKAAKTFTSPRIDLGLLYGLGRPDFPKNYKEAAYWMHIGYGDARPFERHLTASDKEELKLRYYNWHEHYNTRVPPPDYEEHPPKWLPAE